MRTYRKQCRGTWMNTLHYFVAPFYALEYSISELGAMQLLALYRTNPERAIASYKQGAGTNMNQSIAAVYRETGVAYDFSDRTIQRMGEFLEGLMMELTP